MNNAVKSAALALFLLSGAAANVTADDLALLTLQNSYQEEVARGVLGNAFTRVDNTFLVIVSSEQTELLDRTGLEYEPIMTDVDPATVSIIRRMDQPALAPLDLSQLGEAVDIGQGLQIVRLTRAMARTVSERSEYTAVPLVERRIRFLYLPPTIATLVSRAIDYPTDSLADLVNMDSVYAYNVRLEDFRTRYIGTDSIDAARDWIVQKFLDWGYTDVSTQVFYDYYGIPCYNIVVVKPGYAEPDKTIVIGGHYDSITLGEEPGPETYAPGSDDNGSGTVVTMEVARVLADVPLRKTVIFMPFSAEEVGLYGSWYAAQSFYGMGTDIEVMYNFDMVGFNEGGWWGLDLSSGTNTAYRQVSEEALDRVTGLLANVTSAGSSSDHASFMDMGYNVVNHIETEFNYDGWHTNLDLTSRMDFDYLTDVVRMAVASLAIVSNSATSTEVSDIIDQGDGQSLEIYWSDCRPEYDYTLVYGTSSGYYTDTMPILGGVCSFVIGGLTEGQQYYFSVVGSIPDGYPAVYSIEGSEMPLLVPRPPTDPRANPEYQAVSLDWVDNREADFDHYRVYRKIGDGSYALLEDNQTESQLLDTDVTGHVHYTYQITAVDHDDYESDYSIEVDAYAATFDGGILLVDETSQSGPMPSQEVQEEFFDTLFGDLPYDMVTVEASDDRLTRNDAGQYSSIFWMDDDLSDKYIRGSEDTLRWYAGYTGNLCVSGFTTIRYWTSEPVVPGEFAYDEFMVAAFEQQMAFDFAGATGQEGWPDVEIGPNSPFGDPPDITTLTLRPGGVPIYLYDSRSDNPGSEGQPCGVYYSGPHGGRVLLGFPLYFLTEESARELVAYAATLFEEGGWSGVHGDVDNDGQIDIADLVFMVDYMFLSGPAPLFMNSIDMDGSCTNDISDLIYLVDYMFHDGPEPLQGCIE